MALSKQESKEELDHQRTMVHQLRKRLRVLEIQMAQQGTHVLPQILTEIDDLKERIRYHEGDIVRLETLIAEGELPLAEVEYRVLLAEAWDTIRGKPSVMNAARLERERLKFGISPERAAQLEQNIRSELAREALDSLNRALLVALLRGTLDTRDSTEKQRETFMSIARAVRLDLSTTLGWIGDILANQTNSIITIFQQLFLAENDIRTYHSEQFHPYSEFLEHLYRLSPINDNQDLPRAVRLLDLLGITHASDLHPPRFWHQSLTNAWNQAVPIGQKAGGEPLFLNLNQHHDGPHGIVAGVSGAGKSELLRTIIASLVVTHSPTQMTLLLIDFKRGTAMRDFEELPHTVGLVTDLHDNRLVEKAITSLKSEIRRRKELLDHNNVVDIIGYRTLISAPMPLPYLLIVVDEFDILVKEQPNFVTELITVAKQGRSLGIHLLLASQEPSTAVKDEIRPQLHFRIALRLGSVQDSREMLERPDAFYLPSDIPGRAYVRVGTQITLFQVARVSAPFQPLSDPDQEVIAVQNPVTGVSISQQPVVKSSDPELDSRPYTDLQFIVDQLKGITSSYVTTQLWPSTGPLA